MGAVVERVGRQAASVPVPSRAPRPERFTALVVMGDAGARETVVRRLRALGAGEVAEASSLAEARRTAFTDLPCGLLVTDLTLPDGSGLALVEQLRSCGWTHGLVLSGADDPVLVRTALGAGIRGMLLSRPAGRGPAGPGGAAVAVHPRAAGGLQGLSSREVQVLQLVADGRSNRDVGDALGLSALTVKSHLARIARKLGTGDRAEMVALAMRGGLIH